MRLLRNYVLCLTTLWVVALYAQSGAGSIQGTIVDASGGVIPGVKITIVNSATGRTASTSTNSRGFYIAPSLFAGDYTLTAAAPGMAEKVVKVSLQVGQAAEVGLTLAVAHQGQAITVEEDITPLATYDNQTIANTLENGRIDQLPVNGRSMSTLVGLTTPGIEAGRANGTFQAAFEWVQDGAVLTNRDTGYNAALPDPDAVRQVRVESANSNARFNRPATAIVTTKSGTNQIHGSAFETARNNGLGIARTRQDQSLRAPHYVRNEFGASGGGPIVIPKLYDGHNRSFFFVAYARSSLRQGLSLPMYVPTEAMRQGDFAGLADGSTGKPFILYDPNTSLSRTANYQRTPFPNNQIPVTRRSPFAAAVFALEPKPTSSDNPFIASNLTTTAPNTSTTPTLTFRLDHQFSKKDTAYLRFSHTDSMAYSISGAAFGGSSPYAGPVMANGAANLNQAATKQYSAALSLTHIFSSTFFSETTLGNQWQGDTNGGAGPQSVNYATQFGLPNPFNQLAFPQIIGTTAQSVGVGNQQGSILAGFAYGTIRRNSQILTNIDENLTKLAGRHQLQFGGRYRHERIGIFPDQYPSCAVSFSGNGTALVSSGSIASGSYTPVGYTGLAVADLYLGSAQSYTTYLNQGYYHFRDQEIATYFQDDIRVTPKLVLNFGLRWEIHPAVHERDKVLTTFDIANKAMVLGEPLSYYYASGATTPAIVQSLQNLGVKFESAKDAGLPSGILKNNFFTFSPRVGVAYRLFGTRHSTVLRAGFGNYIYPPAVRNFYSNTRKNVPFTEAYTQNYNNAAQSPDGIANYLIRQPQAVVAGLNSANAVNTSVLPPGVTASGFAADYPVTYVQQYNMTIEQRLRPSAVLRVTYLFVHGQNLEQYREYNSAPSNYVYFTRTGMPLGSGPTSSIAQNLYDNTTYGTVEVQQKTGYSNNSSLQVNFQRLYTKGLAFQAYYTLSSALRAGGNGWRDSMISPLGIYLDGQGPATLDEANRLVNYLRDTGIPQHRVRANGIFDIPVGRGKQFLSKSNRFVEQVVGGWQIASTFTVNSQIFPLSTNNWGAISPTVTYGDSVPVQDCRSGVCYKAYLYFNGYISPNLINNSKNGIMGIPDNYVANLAPLNAASGTNTVSVTLKDGTVVNNVTYSRGPGLHPYNKAFIKGPFNWNSDASLFKVFPITEKWKLRVSADFFNVFNHQGSINPDSTTGIQSTRSSYNSARQFQLSGRILF